ncbi:MAG TPA: DUF3833 domain-containing protein [Cellvibrionaceae bacterium]
MLNTRLYRIATGTLLALFLSACAGTDIQRYKGNQPAFILQEFFNGDLSAHGVVKNRSGEVTRYFNATIKATWENGIGTLDERFEFDDGEIQTRVWTLTPTADNTFTGTAGDVIGTGQGKLAGNALQLAYVLEIDYKGRKLALNVDDWMWRVDDTTVINNSTLSKWGFRVGSIQLVIEKHAP